MNTLLRCTALSLLLAAAAPAAEPEPKVDFQRDIWPLLEARCLDCHGAQVQEGKLRLDAHAMTLHGGVSGPAVVAGKPEAGTLLPRVLGEGDLDRMPLDDDPLSAEEIELLRRWIAAGAPWPEGIGSNVRPPQTHWAYRPPVRPEPPAVQHPEWPRRPIDRFVLARLEAEGLSPAPEAERHTLLRRVSLDLIGLPPTVEELQAFLADERPDAYERAVDRLLASPRYGEHWARRWLDLARYADTNGYQADQFRSVWPYRDWVINAINHDLPFDQFTRDQLAGDLLPNPTVEQKIATGFHRLTTCNVEAGVDPEENRVNQVFDRVNTTGTVWLGTTLECCQCHNHKYDPFTQDDYYRLFAYFNNTPLEVSGDGVTFNFIGPKMELPLPAEQQQRRRELQTRLEERQGELKARLALHERQFPAWLAGLRKEPSVGAWEPLEVLEFRSEGGAEGKVLEDRSVLVGGARPEKDVYTVVYRTALRDITALRLEALTDPSLPGGGPGRHHEERPNFVLYEFTVTAQAAGEQTAGERAAPRKVELHGARADFSQPNWDVAGAVDGRPETGWAINPQFGQPHWAEFLTRRPLGFEQGTLLTAVFDQHYGGCRTLGRFRLSARTGDVPAESLPAELAAILAKPEDKWSKQERQKLREHHAGLDGEAARLRGEIGAIEKELTAGSTPSTLVMIEDSPRETRMFKRGDFQQPGGAVEPGTPRSLPGVEEEVPANRLGLARWLTDRNNPLTARVAVNRWWAEFFGRGLVATEEDFGTQGEAPTHPEVLDWLAVEFMENGWSRKRLQREIVLSAVYRQDSRASAEQRAADPENLRLARGPRFRLAAETIRDNALAASGLLSTKMGGEPVFPPQPAGIWRHVGRNAPKYETSTGEDRFRRGVYVFWRRSAPYPAFTNFDAPDRASCTAARPRTNTPLQALTLLNDPAYFEMARALAARLAEHSGSTAERIAHGFERCLARRPTTVELAHLEQVFERERARFSEDPKTARAVAGDVPQEINPADLAAWCYVANILLNLDEMITKG